MLLLTLTPILLLLLSPTTATEEEISWKVTSLLQTDTSAPDDSYREREFSFNINTDEFICRNVLRIADTTSIPNWTNWTGGCVDKQGEDVDVEVFAFRFVSDWAEFIVDNAHDCVLALRQGVDDGEGDGDGDER
ncbi:hypothetical protein GGS20DRAFT_583808 [Poronia punctata]|nr:hypothetical protein GGS20DRAFT_583808 [Poronia punctata]